MDLSAINNVGKMAEFLPTKKLADLKTQRDYPITNLKFAQTKHGKRIVAEVGNEFAIFLPERLAKAFNIEEELFKHMVQSSHKGQLYMRYFGGKYNSLEFKYL